VEKMLHIGDILFVNVLDIDHIYVNFFLLGRIKVSCRFEMVL